MMSAKISQVSRELIRKQPTLDSTKPGGIKSIQARFTQINRAGTVAIVSNIKPSPITKPKMEARVEPIAIRKPSSARRRLT